MTVGELIPPAVAHGEGREAHKGRGSVTGKRWRREERGWRADRGGEKREVPFQRTAAVLETERELTLGGFTEYISGGNRDLLTCL